MNRHARWFVLLIAVVLITIPVSAIPGPDIHGLARGSGTTPRVVKMAVTGDTMTPLAGRVENLALDDGIHVYDRSGRIIGVIRAEANLMKEYGSDRARENAEGVLQNLSHEFFADIWIDFNVTAEWTTVTIRVGDATKVLSFPTPLNPAETQARAADVYREAQNMLGS